MKRAILSDIHGNMPALNAVLCDIEARSRREKDPVESLICLGDTVGYGPHPRECLEKVRTWDLVLQGNHDRGVALKAQTPEFGISSASGFGGRGAFEGVHWSLRQLCGDATPIPSMDGNRQAWKADVEQQTLALLERLQDPDYAEHLVESLCADFEPTDDFAVSRLFARQSDIVRQVMRHLMRDTNAQKLMATFRDRLAVRADLERQVKYLADLPREHRLGSALLVHDNPLQPGDCRYILDARTLQGLRPAMRQAAMNTDAIFDAWDRRWPDVDTIIFGHSHVPGIHACRDRKGRMLVNPGSVGFPRDGQTATYCIWNDKAPGKQAFRIISVALPQDGRTGREMEAAGLPNKLSLRTEGHRELD